MNYAGGLYIFPELYFALFCQREKRSLMEEADKKLIKKALEGDNRSFDSLITAYRGRIISVCLKYMRNREEALDMAQEVFCAAYKSLKSFKFEAKFSTWLYRIAVNLCINRLDALKRRKYFATESISGEGSPGSRVVEIRDKRRPADEELEAAEVRDIIKKEATGFREPDRSIIIMRDLEGLEYEEISEVLKIPLGSIKSKLSRARERLKTRLCRRIGERDEM
ncbi:MAG TPA: sigma-70 family RNA polymerase sigma factor [bacterium]|nr:sigma-70 family RNA polymerase sigma factor [bacterium]